MDIIRDTESDSELLTRIAEGWAGKQSPTFDELSVSVLKTHQTTQASAFHAVNQMATLRNWLIGYYIVEYEQKGRDRAKYGDRLLKRLEESVDTKGLNLTLFKVSRNFYLYYPQIAELFHVSIHPMASDESVNEKGATASHQFNNVGTLQKSATASHQFITAPHTILSKLSFSHIREIMTQDDPLARFFYETECIKGTWSVKELRRQIATNLYFRSGVSKDPKKLLATIKPETNTPSLAIRQPFTFEFLGLKAKDVITEEDLEDALISHLQDFLLELGKGFCFEARQKRIIIDDEYYYPDLVFYHRILHCSVIVELKNDEFRHEHLGQLNAYVSYYKENEMHDGDNPPIGILLCTRKGKKMVEYALAGLDNQLFVSTYMLQLPDKDTLEKFLMDEMENHSEKV
jgi:predicted nuclease of restriction endonuclease-like (RecB) superfamily